MDVNSNLTGLKRNKTLSWISLGLGFGFYRRFSTMDSTEHHAESESFTLDIRNKIVFRQWMMKDDITLPSWNLCFYLPSISKVMAHC